jgi:7-cyano-7-deazaguanine synthase in queuosine biosynthesis
MRILCTLSGGSDSAYAAFVAQKRWPEAEFHSLFVDYGQPEIGPEMEASVKVHNKLKFPAWAWHDVRIQWLYENFDRSHRDDLNSLYVPHRNLVIASIAAARADKLGAEKVVVGNKSFQKTEGDFLTYDGNREFYKALEAVVQMIQVRGPKLEIVPTLSEFTNKKLTRQDVYFGLWTNGFHFNDTFSCWFAVDNKGCGTCKNCLEKQGLWEHWQNVMGS